MKITNMRCEYCGGYLVEASRFGWKRKKFVCKNKACREKKRRARESGNGAVSRKYEVQL